MQKTARDFPDWINEFVLDDELFARAYETVPDDRRALLKTGIARLYQWYGPSRADARRTAVSWRGGFDSVEEGGPADYAVVVFDAALASPARLLAALVPALSRGVRRVLAVRLGEGGWPEPVLTGLELAGQELVAAMAPERVLALLEEIDGSGATGVVIGLELPEGVFRSLRFPTRRIRFVCLKCDPQVAVWMDPEQPFDLDALAFAQPDLEFTVHGAEGALPKGFARGGKDARGFLDAVREAAFAPASLVDETLGRARLVLGPGQEGCWVWPQLRPEDFLFHSIAWTIGA